MGSVIAVFVLPEGRNALPEGKFFCYLCENRSI